MDIEKKIAELQEEVRRFKTSQAIGQSNSTNYKIVSGAKMTIATNQYKYGDATITFTSSGRAFPHFCYTVDSYTVSDGGTATITPYYLPQYTWSEQADLYKDSMLIQVRTSSASQTVTIYFTIYSDTPGTYVVS